MNIRVLAVRRFPVFGAGLFVVMLVGATALSISLSTAPVPVPSIAVDGRTQSVLFRGVPLTFEPNVGQGDSAALYFARGMGYGMALSASSAVLHFCDYASKRDQHCSTVRAELVGVSERVAVAGEKPLPGESNYFVGNDSSEWRRGVAQYSQVRYREAYPGIDLVFYGNERELEYDFIVAPGADPGRIRLSYSGAERLYLDGHGDLHIVGAGGELVQRKPEIYQMVDGRKVRVDGHFELAHKGPGAEVGLVLGRFDAELPLTIDPVLTYSTFLGGGGADAAAAIALDADGNAYVAGFTSSVDFPVKDPQQLNENARTLVFVTKLDADGRTLVYSTYFGGNGDSDIPSAIAVDADGSAYVVGETVSTDFPTAFPFQARHAGGRDVFLSKLSPDGSRLVFSTYLGGAGNDRGRALKVDAGSNVYLAGVTNSVDFPVQNALQNAKAGNDSTPDIFVSKLDSGGGALLYSTYIGGSNTDGETGVALAVDVSGHAYVVGGTYSDDFPVVSAFQSRKSSSVSVQSPFVAKLDVGGGALLYATYLSGSDSAAGVTDLATGVSVDDDGSAYVVGSTTASDFPTTPNAVQAHRVGPVDIFVSKLDPAGGALLYSTYLGGTDSDEAKGIVVDAFGRAYLAGTTLSTDFPGAEPLGSGAATGFDAFVAMLNSEGSDLVYSAYLGGSDGGSSAFGLAVDSDGAAYIAGATGANEFPVLQAFQPQFAGGGADAFVAKVSLLPGEAGDSGGGGGQGGGGPGGGPGGAGGGSQSSSGGGCFGLVPLVVLFGLNLVRWYDPRRRSRRALALRIGCASGHCSSPKRVRGSLRRKWLSSAKRRFG